ncbi:Two component system response regulator/histidine kinase [Desulfonema limicola]|uniref:histidine kinase n=1 Tax=Desulfonema limicola TaxID=45656 RepID=A0A975GJI3_9BACT|nr:Two component system response regulator/histidine kinase [Desulfonema limicola]
MKENILIVDDEADILNLLQFTLTAEGFNVSTASNGKEALEAFHAGNFDLVLTDIKMPVMDGLELIGHLREKNADAEVIVLTGHASVEIAVDALKNGGAFDFFQKPLDDIDHLLMTINRALERQRLKKERDMALTRLKASENFSQAVINSLPSHILVLDKKGIIIKVNQSWKQFVREHFEKAFRPGIGDNYLVSCISKMDKPEAAIIEAGIKSLLNGEMKHFEKEFIFRMSFPEKHFLMQGRQLQDSQGLVLISQIDITMIKSMETELINARKDEALKTLTTGIAHQYNNALNGISGAAEILKDRLGNEEIVLQMLNIIIKSVRQMAGYNSQLTAYTERNLNEEQAVLLNPIIENTVNSMENILENPHEVRLDLSYDVQYIKGYNDKIQAVIYELILNAVEATEGTGNISISSKKEWVNLPPAKAPSDTPGYYYVISVTDDGVGIEDKIKNRIFDPFFTTKFIGRGLGLPAAHGIVMTHRGWIAMNSHEGGGTEMKVFLPVYEKPDEKRELKKMKLKKLIKLCSLLKIIFLILNLQRLFLRQQDLKYLKQKMVSRPFPLLKTMKMILILPCLTLFFLIWGLRTFIPALRLPDLK